MRLNPTEMDACHQLLRRLAYTRLLAGALRPA
jgi:hypothetical protein